MNEAIIQDFIMFVVYSQFAKTAYILLFPTVAFGQLNEVLEFSSFF